MRDVQKDYIYSLALDPNYVTHNVNSIFINKKNHMTTNTNCGYFSPMKNFL